MTANPDLRRGFPQGRPDTASLCALGPVLCLQAASDPHPLSGWSRAQFAAACVQLHADGPRESVCFFTETGEACWQLHLLPDSDFLAWSHLLDQLPSLHPDALHARHWLARCRQVVRPAWRACALRLHPIPECSGDTALAATDVLLSPLGEERARRIHRDISLAPVMPAH